MNEPDKHVTDPELAPRLTDEQWDRLCARGTIRDVDDGEILFATGQRDYPMILVEDGEIEIVRDSLAWLDEDVIAVMGPRSFAGELGLLNGQRAFLTARAIGPGRVREISRSDLRRLLAELDRDDAGFIRTGTDVTRQSLDRWQTMGREPLPFETSVPRVFAAGDVRRGSMKRVAAAVGEGSSAVASVHRALAAQPVT